MNIILLDDISRIIWKSYYSNYVIPIISFRKESTLYLKDNTPIHANLSSSPLNIYSRNYNILRIMSGLPGLAYS